LCIAADSFATAGVNASEAGALHFPNLRDASVAVSLRRAYDSIRDERAKKLFLILSLLPAEHRITRDMLPLFLEGFGAAHDQASKYLAWLASSGLVLVEESKRLTNTPVREIASVLK
jgi:hypothetical protein